MTTVPEALLKAIIDDPADDLPRLAHCPYMLDERLFDCFGAGVLDDPKRPPALHRYAARDRAVAALSDACLAYARREARKRRKEAASAAHP